MLDPKPYTISYWPGDTKDLVVTYADATGVPIDASGYTGDLVIYSGITVVQTITVTGAVNGTFSFHATAANTALWSSSSATDYTVRVQNTAVTDKHVLLFGPVVKLVRFGQ